MAECAGPNPASAFVTAALMRADGLPRREIARRLGVRPETVSTYIWKAVQELGARSVDEVPAIVIDGKPPSDDVVIVDAKDVIASFAAAHGVRYADLLYGGRSRDLIKVRHDCIRYLAALDPTLSTWEIGAAMRVDHTTVGYVLGRTKRRPATLRQEVAA